MTSFGRGSVRRCFSAFANIYGFQISGQMPQAAGCLCVAGLLALSSVSPVLAGPDACDSTANTATCSDDQSDGIATGSDGVESDDNVLIVESLIADIVPASDTDGIRFTPDTEDPIEANVTLGGFAVVTSGDADGVYVGSVHEIGQIAEQVTVQTNENEQASDVLQDPGLLAEVTQVQSLEQENVSVQAMQQESEEETTAVTLDVTGVIESNAWGIVAESRISHRANGAQTIDQANLNAQSALVAGGDADAEQEQNATQTNEGDQVYEVTSALTAGNVAITYEGTLDAAGDGIAALSESVIEIDASQTVSQSNENTQSADATALDVDGAATIDQGHSDEGVVLGITQSNTATQTQTVGATAGAGNAEITSTGPIAAGGAGLSARSVANVDIALEQSLIQTSDTSQTATAIGFDVMIDQVQDVDHENTATLSMDVTATATSDDATISSTGAVDAAGVGLEATSVADVQVAMTQEATLDIDAEQTLNESGATNFSGSQSQTQNRTSDLTVEQSAILTATSGNAEVHNVGDISSGQDAILAQSLATAEIDSSGVFSQSYGNDQEAETEFDVTQTETLSGPGFVDNEFTFVLQSTATAGDVTVDSEGDLDAAGNGIVARSVATASGIDPTATSGSVTVIQDGDVTAGMHGILAESLAVIPLGINPVTTMDRVSVTVENGSVLGDDGYYGVKIDGGSDNTFTNHGSVSSLSGQAILTTFGNDTIDNHGMVIGEVVLGTGTNAFNNLLGGSFYSSATADLGGGLLTNDGSLDPGGPDTIQTTAMTGGITQSGGGNYAVDVDMATGISDRIDATGSASLDGEVAPNLLNFMSLTSTTTTATILTADGGVTDNGLSADASDSLFIDFELLYPTSTEVLLEVNVDLASDMADLNDNQSALGDHLTEALEEGIPPELAELYAEIFGITDPDELAAYYDALSPEVFAQLQALALYGVADFADAMMSCGGTEAPNAAIREGECVWMTGSYRSLDRDGDSDTFGYEEEAWGLTGGVQLALDETWRLGVAGGYERSDLDSRGGDVDGDHVHAGFVVKYSDGPLLLAGGLSGGYAWYDAERSTPLGASSADPELGYVNGRLRAAYLFEPGGSLYVKPLADLNLTYLHLNDFQESGAGAANLDVEDGDETILSFSPAVEFGADADLGGGAVLRPFLRGGITVYSDTEIGVGASFDGAPAGADPFQVTTEIDRVVADVAAGVELFTDGGVSFRLGYDGRFSDDLESHAVSGKVAVSF